MDKGPHTGRPWLRIFAISFGGLSSIPVLLVAILWGLHQESALYQGSGVDVPASLHGYNVVISGSTSGIGFEAALEFFRRGAHVIIHSSSLQRAAKSAAEVRNLGGKSVGKATPMAMNLANFDEVRRFAQELPKVMHRVDVLILNACKMYGLSPQYNDQTLMRQPASTFQSPSGHDSVYSINHLGHVLMAETLLPLLAHGARIVIMAAIGGWDGSHHRLLPPWGHIGEYNFHPKSANRKRIIWEQQGLKQHAYKAYHDSKLANVCFGRWLRRRLVRNATVVLHDPGYVLTTPMLDRNSGAYQNRAPRSGAWSEDKWRHWHAPPQDGGRHLMQAAFVTRFPVPDVVSTYFMPRQLIRPFATYAWEDSQRAGWVTEFSNYQRLTWGLHETIGPGCEEELQNQLARWSLQAVAPQPPRA